MNANFQAREFARRLSLGSWALVFCSVLSCGLCLDRVNTAQARNNNGIERVALIAWHDQGWKGVVSDQKLRYARRDAEMIASVLRRKGHFQVHTMARPTAAALWKNLYLLTHRAKQRGKKLHFLFYYSGHADEKYLRLGDRSRAPGMRFALRDLASFFRKLDAFVKIAILDACHSGAFIDMLHTRTKGRGRGFLPFFQIPRTLSRGMAVLTSASAVGTAREVDKLGASLFTYYLVKGLQGEADVDKDGQVTTLEAYRHARVMLERALPGRQQPMFLNHFRGQEAYPITTFYNASLVLPMRPGDRYTLLGKRMVRRLRSKKRAPQLIPLLAGRYRVFLQDKHKHCFSQEIKVPERRPMWLRARWRKSTCPTGTKKGKAGLAHRSRLAFMDVERAPLVHRYEPDTWLDRPRLNASFGIGSLNASLFRPFMGVQAGFSWEGARFGVSGQWGNQPGFEALYLELHLGYGWAKAWDDWGLFLGGVVAAGIITVNATQEQQLSGWSPSFRYGLQAEVSYRIVSRLLLTLRLFAGPTHTLVRGQTFTNQWPNGIPPENVSPDTLTAFAFQSVLALEWRL